MPDGYVGVHFRKRSTLEGSMFGANPPRLSRTHSDDVLEYAARFVRSSTNGLADSWTPEVARRGAGTRSATLGTERDRRAST